MSSNKLIYDPCSFSQRLKESTSPLDYQTKAPLISKGYAFNPGFLSDDRGVSDNKIDIESDMKNLTRPNSECPTKQFPFKSIRHQTNKYPEINGLVTDYTREKRPCNVLSGVNINRFEPLCKNFQDTSLIHSNCYVGINTRNYHKEVKTKPEPPVFKDSGACCEVSEKKSYHLKCKNISKGYSDNILPANFKIPKNKIKKAPKCDITLG